MIGWTKKSQPASRDKFKGAINKPYKKNKQAKSNNQFLQKKIEFNVNLIIHYFQTST